MKLRPSPDASSELRDELLTKDVRRRASLRRLAKAAKAGDVPARNDLLPPLTIVQRDPRTLQVPSSNVRKVEQGHLQELINSIRVFGFTHPLLIASDGTIVDGVIRTHAARVLGLPTISCIPVDHLTARDLRLLRLTLNRLGEKGSWELSELTAELANLTIEGASTAITGFDDAFVDTLLADPLELGELGELEPEPGRPAIAQVGDIFVCGPHRVACGDTKDARLLARLMGERQARIVLTDQPFNVKIAGHVTRGPHREFAEASGEMSEAGFARFNEGWIGGAIHHLVDGGILGTFIDWRGLGSVMSAALKLDLTQINLIVWGKTNAGMGSLYRSHHELLPLFKKGHQPHVNNVELGRKGRWRSNLWTYPGASSIGSDARRGLKDHPTVKPVAMLEDALRDLTNRGDVVLDPFLGSGSTLIAAEKIKRVCYGVEIDPLYVDVIVRRYEKVTGKRAVLEETGETYAELEARRLQVASVDEEADET